MADKMAEQQQNCDQEDKMADQQQNGYLDKPSDHEGNKDQLDFND